MADSCSLNKEVNQAKLDYLITNANELAKVLSVVKTPIKSLHGIDPRTIDSTDKLLSAIFNDKDVKLETKTDAQRKLAIDTMDQIVSEVYRSMEDPIGVMKSMSHNSRIYKALKRSAALSKIDVAMERMWWWCLKHIGLDPGSLQKTDVFGVRMNKYEQFEPSRVAFRLVSEIEEYANKNVERISSRARLLLTKAADSSVLKNSGIDTFDKVSSLFIFFDEGRTKKFMNMYKTRSEEDAFIRYASLRGITITKEQVASVMSEFHILRSSFNKLNYGDVDVDNMKPDEILNSASPTSVVGFIRDLKDKLTHMHSLMKGAGVADGDMKEFDNIIKKLNKFTPRKNYVPYVSDKDDDIFSIIDDMKKDSVLTASWLDKRKDMTDTEDLLSGNFIDSLTMNLAATSLMAKELANSFFATYLRKEVDSNGNWFNSAPERLTVKYAIEQGIQIAKATRRSPLLDDNKKVMSVVRATSSLAGASILALPGSAIKNLIAGTLNMFWRFGLKATSGDYLSNLQEGDLVATKCKEYTDKYLISTGVASEYVQNRSVDSQRLVTEWEDKVRDFLMKNADFISDGMYMGRLWSFWKDNLTTKGTEERMRAKLGSLLYNKVRDEFTLKSISNPTAEQVTRFIEDNVDQIFYDANNALGNYSALNKPFATRALLESAETTPMLIVGVLANLAYMFRHAGFVTAQNFMHALSDVKNKNPNPYATRKEKISEGLRFGSLVAGLLVALYEMAKRTFLSNNNDIPKVGSSVTSAINPFEEVDALPKLGISLMLRAFLNEGMSDKDYELVKNEALSYAFGILSGSASNNRISSIMFDAKRQSEDFVNETLNYSSVMDFFLTNGTLETGYAAITELSQGTRERENVFNDYLMFDPLFIAARLASVINVDAPNDPVSAWKYRAQLLGRTTATAFAFNFWVENQMIPSDYAYDNEFSKNTGHAHASAALRANRMNNRRLTQVGLKSSDYFFKYGAKGREPKLGTN